MKPLRTLASGLSVLSAVLSSPSSYPNTAGGFAKDRAKLQGDANKVVKTLNRNIRQEYRATYGK